MTDENQTPNPNDDSERATSERTVSNAAAESAAPISREESLAPATMASREEILADFQVGARRNGEPAESWTRNLSPLQACTGIEDVEVAICQLEEAGWVLVVSGRVKL